MTTSDTPPNTQRPGWGLRARRWNYFKDALVERFGGVVYKVGVDAGFDCPNRDGTKGYGGCAYCSQEGSFSPHQDARLSIRDQIEKGRAFVKRRYRAEKIIVYLQAFTNTYGPLETLRARFEACIEGDAEFQKDLVGMSVATRPDCIDEARADLLAEYAQRFPYFTVELGLQSAYQYRLPWLNRLEGTDDYIRAMKLLSERKIPVITHIILGFPGESQQDMRDTVDLAQNCGSQGLKLQMLHVIKGTKLAWMYNKAPFQMMDAEDYGECIIDLIERIDPRVEIHRITGETENSSLIAPDWVRQKAKFLLWFEAELASRDTWQGRRYLASRSSSSPEGASEYVRTVSAPSSQPPEFSELSRDLRGL